MPRGSTYVDNSLNRRLGRVGAPMGSMPVSSSSSGGGYSSSGSHTTYVDNSFNRRVGRVGMPMGSAPVSLSSFASSSGAGYSSSGSHTMHVDNPFNRSVGREEMSLGSAPVSLSSSASSQHSGNSSAGSSDTNGDNAYNRKVYKDNVFNRHLGRVGMPLGSMSHSRQGSTSTGFYMYVDSAENRRLDRVGKKCGSMPVSKTGKPNSRKETQEIHVLNEMFIHLTTSDAADFEALPCDIPEKELENMCNTVLSLIERMNQALKWQQSNKGKLPRTALNTFKYDGPVFKFEDIEILKKIGHGGFGDVHFGKYKGTVVAVKKLRVKRVSKPRLRQFRGEVEILCRLDHPHIVKFLGASIVTPNLAILMEYMQESLYEALHVEEQDFTPKQQCQILLHMADGLAYLHGKSVAHCDMKSTNILLDSIDDELVAKISDFGLSMMKSETETSQSTAKVKGVGTPTYSAPEVLAGEELGLPAMCKADVYSMSVVAWEVLSQEVPFSGLNIHQLMRRVCSGDVNLKFPEDVKIGDGVKDLLKECWRHDADKRPTAPAFKDRLVRFGSIL